MSLTRRTFLGGSLAAFVAACSNGSNESSSTTTTAEPGPSTPTSSLVIPDSDLTADPFTLGIASGDPTDEAVVIWTRLVPDRTSDDGGMPDVDVDVAWEVANDEEFDDVVAQGLVSAKVALAHSVHVDVDGLDPASTYFYRFLLGDFVSPVGRTRTMPGASADEDEADEFRFAFASCQDFADGFWAAHRHLAEEEIDLVVWLGDYIYEAAGRDAAGPEVRSHEGPEARTLDQYRSRYAQYKSEADLQAAHAAAPWAVTWDDHEVDNNHAGDNSNGDEAPDAFRSRRAAAYQAWYEHQPVRLPPPSGPDYPIERQVVAGELVTLFLLDSRQHRSDQPCGVEGDVGQLCDEANDKSRTMLGPEQEEALAAGLVASETVWNVVGNQTILTPVNIEVGPLQFANLDQWDGYPAARQRLLDVLADVSNPVVITGDIHASGVADLVADAADPDSAIIAAELVGTSISSAFPPEFIDLFESAIAATPNIVFADARRRGYVLCTVTPETLRAEYRLLTDGLDPDSAIDTAATFELTAGTPGAKQV